MGCADMVAQAAVMGDVNASCLHRKGEGPVQLSIRGVGKQYRRDFWGLRDFTLEMTSGVLGLLGPNGAGKSTLMRILATITSPSRGQVCWNDIDITKDPNPLREVLGYLPQDFGVYPNLSAVEFLEYIAAMKGLERRTARQRIEELLALTNLAGVARRPLGGYSGGMKQRVGIAQALLNDPQLLIVDEPTAGLDPEERVRFRGLLADISSARIIILSTHIVSDVEATATEIAILNRGCLVVHDLPEHILQPVEGQVWEWVVPSGALAGIQERAIISSTLRRSDGVLVRVVAQRCPSDDAQPVAARLEDAYLYFVKAQGGTS